MTKTERIIMDYNPDELMIGNETYKILGNLLSDRDRIIITRGCSLLKLTADCDKKAFLVKDYFMCFRREFNWRVMMGSIKIFSLDMLATYGHNYNPPFEFHCWLEKEENGKKFIIDLALPGTIIRGLRARDEIGSFLEGREPVILAGEAPDWIIYESKTQIIR